MWKSIFLGTLTIISQDDIHGSSYNWYRYTKIVHLSWHVDLQNTEHPSEMKAVDSVKVVDGTSDGATNIVSTSHQSNLLSR